MKDEAQQAPAADPLAGKRRVLGDPANPQMMRGNAASAIGSTQQPYQLPPDGTLGGAMTPAMQRFAVPGAVAKPLPFDPSTQGAGDLNARMQTMTPGSQAFPGGGQVQTDPAGGDMIDTVGGLPAGAGALGPRPTQTFSTQPQQQPQQPSQFGQIATGNNNPMLDAYLKSGVGPGPSMSAGDFGPGPGPSVAGPAPAPSNPGEPFNPALQPQGQPQMSTPNSVTNGGGAPQKMHNEWGDILAGLDLSKIPGLVGGDALTGTMNDARDSSYRQAASYLDPQWQQDQKALENKLVNQGVMQNSEAWNKAMDDFGRQKEFAYSQARNASFQQGLTAQGQMWNQGLLANQNGFNQALQTGQFGNSAQNQNATQGLQNRQITSQLQGTQAMANAQAAAAGAAASASTQNVRAQLEAQAEQNRFNNSLAMRNQGINELLLQQQNPLQMANLLGQGTGVQQPNFTSTPGTNMNPADIASYINNAYNGSLNGYNAQTSSNNSSNAAMASIIAAYLCDRRLKTNVVCIGKLENGLNLYEYDYLWGEHAVGVMADEVEEVMPDAIIHLPHGFKAVNYARL